MTGATAKATQRKTIAQARIIPEADTFTVRISKTSAAHAVAMTASMHPSAGAPTNEHHARHSQAAAVIPPARCNQTTCLNLSSVEKIPPIINDFKTFSGCCVFPRQARFAPRSFGRRALGASAKGLQACSVSRAPPRRSRKSSRKSWIHLQIVGSNEQAAR